ncbi:MAG: YbaK/EbsC family protein [Anaerovoracaceae bacterium]
MGIDKVREYFKRWGREEEIIEFPVSSATVELAAEAAGVIPARIAKTLSFKNGDDGCVLIVTSGNMKIDNQKFKGYFGMKAKMLSPDEVVKYTGYEIGGVCPFAIDHPGVKIYCDVSMKKYETVFPACGSDNSAIELTGDEIFEFCNGAAWIDVCKER